MNKKIIPICLSIILLICILILIGLKIFYKPEFYSLDEEKVYLEKKQLEVYDYLDLSEILHMCERAHV